MSDKDVLAAELRGACRGWFEMTAFIPWSLVEDAFAAGYQYALTQKIASPKTNRGTG